MNLLEILDEQSVVTFTGRVNILASTNQQFLGAIYMESGFIVNAEFKAGRDKRALFQVLYEENQDSDSFSYVIEPELIDEKLLAFKLEVDAFRNELDKFFSKYRETEKFVPPKGIKLVIDSEFIEEGDHVTSDEFEVLSVLANYNSVEEIYDKCGLYDFEITTALVNLRQKGALKVLK